MLSRAQRKNKSVFLHFIQPMIVFVIIQAIILVGYLSLSQLFPYINKNSKDIVNERVLNRSSYLQNEMINNWSNLNETVEYINDVADNLNQQGIINYSTLDDSSLNATPLLLKITDKLVSTMRLQRVTGAYVIFNTQNLDMGLEDKPGIYIRDLDPASKESYNNADLLFERAPTEVVRELNISTDSSWQPRFEFKKNNIDYYDFFYTPFQEAYKNTKEFSAADLGYWGNAYSLNGDDKKVITYSLPLINESGLVYGIVGVDITLDYLNRLLPSNELFEGGMGSYLLAIKHDNDNIENVFINGNSYTTSKKTTLLQGEVDDYYIDNKDGTLYSALEYLNVYNTNTPYSNQKWVLIGIVSAEYLFAFTKKIIYTLIIVVLLILLVGIVGSFLASYFISKPIKRLSQEVETTRDKNINLVKTNIKEIDHLSDTMKQLNKNIQDTSMKFSKILKMASVKLAGFEYNGNTKELFVSDNFFSILLNEEINTYNMTSHEFIREVIKYRKYIISKSNDPIEYILKIPNANGYIFVNLKLVVDKKIYMGVIEDITSSILEKRSIEYERDHDTLTGLLNRRAFSRLTNDLFENHSDNLKISALVMLDLDDLKHINDTYGHEMGDRYIYVAAEAFRKSVPKNTIISRVSGDEFFILFYGYNNENEIWVHLNNLKSNIKNAYITIASDKKFEVRASGGIAWYPKDTDSFEILQKYADFAMYRVKRAGKGNLTNFDSNDYLLDTYLNQARKELNMIIEDNKVQFYLQPIIDSHNGTVFAYEALMRSFMPILKSPLDILKVAEEQGRLKDIELLTWINALEIYTEHVKNDFIDVKTKIFINSLSSQILPLETINILEKKYERFLKNIVLEISEVEAINKEYWLQKEKYINKWHGEIALDDYGSGYNSEKTLLAISPKYIKIDLEIIRDIDSNLDKQKIVENIVNYAHERKMKVVAEGIETKAELKQVIKLGVDYLQGFILAKPQYIPPVITNEMIELIEKYNKEVNSF